LRFVLVEALAKIRNSTRRKVLRKGFGDLKNNSVNKITVCMCSAPTVKIVISALQWLGGRKMLRPALQKIEEKQVLLYGAHRGRYSTVQINSSSELQQNPEYKRLIQVKVHATFSLYIKKF